MSTLSNKFNFWLPATITKGGDSDEYYLEGIASTNDEDRQGQILEPSGFNLKPFLEKGFVNWDHKSKDDPGAVIGEPVEARVIDGGKKLYVKVKLYPEIEKAKKVIDLATALQKSSSGRALGFSIEGNPVGQTKTDKRILKTDITGLAITHKPVNFNTYCSIVKGEYDEMFIDSIYDDEVEKATSTESISPLMKESVEGAKELSEEEEEEKKEEVLKKSEIYELIMKSFPSQEVSIYKNIFNYLEKTNKEMSTENIQKALNTLVEKANEQVQEIQKSEEVVTTNTVDDSEIQKSIQELYLEGNTTSNSLLGNLIIKGFQIEDSNKAIEKFMKERESNPEIQKSLDDNLLIKRIAVLFDDKFKNSAQLIKSVLERNSELEKRVEGLEKSLNQSTLVNTTPVRKSLTSTSFKPSPLEKSMEDDTLNTNTLDLSIPSDRKKLGEIILFEAGELRKSNNPDLELEKSVTYLDLGATIDDIPASVQLRLKGKGWNLK